MTEQDLRRRWCADRWLRWAFFLAGSRAEMSVPPPGANAITTRTRCGHGVTMRTPGLAIEHLL